VLARIYEGLEDWREALTHQKRYQELRLDHDRELFSSRTRALQMQHEVERARREQMLLRTKNHELTTAYDELQNLHRALRVQADELERLSLEDPLTGLHNRRSLEQRAGDERARIERYGGTYSVLVCDIDNFKETNDRFSHAVGDAVLERVGEILRKATRDVDVAARFGGEEFVVMLPATTAAEAAVVADKIREAVAAHPWEAVQAGLSVTISVGVAQARDRERFEAVFAMADKQLYRAKDAGKNRVAVANSEVNPGDSAR
jgi:diguanylate cyclase (GGDEF)-like protein